MENDLAKTFSVGQSKSFAAFVFTFALSMLMVPSAQAAIKYWIGPADGNFTSNSNWSTTSGGANNTTAPTSSDVATFDGGGNTNCTLDNTISVAGIDIKANYSAVISQSAAITIGANGYTQASGTFTGGSQAIDINGDYIISGGTFTATGGTMTIERSFTKSGSPVWNANGGTVAFDGAYTGGNTLIDASGVTFNVVTINRTIFEFDKTLTITSGTTIPLGNSPTATLNNNMASYHLTNNGTITVGTGTAIFNISGVLTNSASCSISGTATVLAFNGSLTNSGTFSFPNVSAPDFNAYSASGYGSVTNNSGATLTFASSPTFTVNGSFVMNTTSTYPANITLTLDGGLAANTTVDASGYTFVTPVTINRTYGWTTSTLTIASGTTIPLGNSPTVTLNNTYMAYNLTNNGTITVGTGTATFNISGAFTNSASHTISGTATALVFNGNMINSGTFNFPSVSTLDFNPYSSSGYGNVTNNSGGTLTFASNPTFTVSGSFVMSPTSTYPVNINLILDGSYDGDTTVDASGYTFATPVTINRSAGPYTMTLTIASGTTIPLGNSPTVTLNNTFVGGYYYNFLNNGTITVGTGTATFNIDGTLTNSASQSISGTATALVFNGNLVNSGTFSFPNVSAPYFNIYGDNGVGSVTNNGTLTFTSASTLNIAGGFTNSASKTITTASSPIFHVGGDFIVDGTSTFPSNITLYLDGTYSAGNSTVSAPSVTYAVPVTINRSVFTAGTTLTIASGTTIPLGNSPTVTLNNTYGGYSHNLTNNGTITVGTGTATFNINGTSTNSAGGSISGSATALSFNGNLINSGTFSFPSVMTPTFGSYGGSGFGTVTNNGTFTFTSASTLNIAGGFTNSASKTITTASSPIFHVGGDFIVDGTSTFPSNITLYLDGTYSAGNSTVSAPSVTYAVPVTINRSVFTAGTTLTIASGTTIPLGNSPTVTLNNTYGGYSHNLTNNGTITVGTGTFAANIKGAFTNNSTITTKTCTRTNSLGGTMTNASGSTVTFTGDGDAAPDVQTISGSNSFSSTSGNAFYNMVINGTDGNQDVFQAGGAMTIGNNMTVASGTFSPNNSLMTGVGTNILDVTGTIRADAPTFGESYTSFETLNLNPGSTVDYSRSGNQAIDLNLSYKNLAISGSSGIKTPAGTLTIPNDLTINSATLSLNGQNLNVTNLFTINTAGTLRVIGSETLNKEPSPDAGTVEYYGTTFSRPVYNWNYTNACVRINAAGQTYTLPAPLIARSLNIADGTLPQDNNSITAGSILQTGGTFTGDPSASPANIITAGDVSLFGGTFTSTKGTLFIGGNLMQAFSTFSHNSGTVDFNGSGAQALFATSTLNNVIHSGAGTLSISPVNVDGTGGTITHNGIYSIHTFTSSGTFVPLAGFFSADVYAWGGGGAGGTKGGWNYGSAGAGAGAANGTLSVAGGTSYPVTVGGGGQVNSFVGAAGGGGAASNNNSDNRYAGGGGGYSGIFLTSVSQANALLIASGGGGGGSSRAGTGNAGGAGGGSSGQVGASPYDGKSAYAGNPGTQSAAGANASSDSPNGGGGQGALQGGVTRSTSYGGGGGGGYWGGSAGGYSEPNTMAGGGGGSGYYSPTYVTSATLTTGSGTTPGDPGNVLRGTAGNAGTVAGAGSSGIVIVRYPTLKNNISLTGNLTNSAGTLDANNQKITLSGNWINNATFIPGTDTVIFNGTNQSITGNNTFYNIKKAVSSEGILGFEEDKTTTVNGNATLTGVSGGLLSLRTVDASGTVLNDSSQSTIDFMGTNYVDYLDIRDNIAASSNSVVVLPVEPPNSIESGNTNNWFCLRASVSGANGANGNYASLTNASGAFATINANDQAGKAIVIRLGCNSIAETGDFSLNTGNWTSLTIYPIVPGITISGPADPWIIINGADRVTIDGRVYATGSVINLTMGKIKYTNAAVSNVIKYCSIEGDFNVLENSSSTVEGELTIGGNLTLEDNSTLSTSLSGNLTVSGTFTIKP